LAPRRGWNPSNFKRVSFNADPVPTTPQDSPSSLGTGVNSGAEDSKHPTTITGWLASKAGMWRVAVWKMRRCWQYMGTAPYVVTKPLILQSLIFPPCGTVPPLLSCARTHHETRDQVIAKSSSPWVLYLSIAVTGNGDGSFSKAPRSSHFSPHTHPLSLPTIAWFGWISARRHRSCFLSLLALENKWRPSW